MSTTSLTQLAELILSNVKVLEGDLAKRGVDAPNLDKPYKSGADLAFDNPEVMLASYLISNAAQQLSQSIRSPHAVLIQEATRVSSYYSSKP